MSASDRVELLVAADDRTGALETAGMCAAAGTGPVAVVTVMEDVERQPTMVVDLGTRHLTAMAAGQRAAAMERWASERAAHKIDSTLRGNWAAELVARHTVHGRRVLVVPAFPLVGRICVDGVVLEHGVPVADGSAAFDVRSATRSSRPADHLRAAGAAEVDLVATPDDVRRWLNGFGASFAVCDAASWEDLVAVGQAWGAVDDSAVGDSNVLLAGTAATIAASLRLGPSHASPFVVTLAAPVLVVCGSVHPVARAQVKALMGAGAECASMEGGVQRLVAALRRGQPGVLSTAMPAGGVAHHEAQGTADRLAAMALAMVKDVGVQTLIILGGDTAAAMLGPQPVLVGGTVAAGMPWCRRVDGDGPLVITRAGGFGSATSLVELLDMRV